MTSGDADVQWSQSDAGVAYQKLVVVRRADAGGGAKQVGEPARTVLHVAATLEPNVRGQPSTGCESTGIIHYLNRLEYYKVFHSLSTFNFRL